MNFLRGAEPVDVSPFFWVFLPSYAFHSIHKFARASQSSFSAKPSLSSSNEKLSGRPKEAVLGSSSYEQQAMVFNTLSVGAAVTPTVIETWFSHVRRL